MTRVAPLAPPWSEADVADINSWGHPDRTYEPLLLVRCVQRHPALAGRLRKLGEALYTEARLPAPCADDRDPTDVRAAALRVRVGWTGRECQNPAHGPR